MTLARPPLGPPPLSRVDPSAPVDESSGRYVPVMVIIASIIRRIWMIAGVGLLVAILAVGWWRMNRQYAAVSVFKPQSSEGRLSRFAGMAAQFGVNLGAMSDEPLEFYARVVHSRGVLEQAAQAEFVIPEGEREQATDSTRADLLMLYDIGGNTPEERLQGVVRRLREDVHVRTDLKAGVIAVRTTTPMPELSEQLNRRILDLVNEFNRNQRQSQATAERRFVSERRDAAQLELQEAERDLAAFLAQNRRYQDSPQLVLQHANLQRRVDLRQQLFVTLAQGLEQARIEEVRSTPVITIVEPPEGSADVRGNPLVVAILGGIVGVLLALSVVTLQAFLSWQRQHNSADYETFLAALRSVLPGSKQRRERHP